MTISIGRRKILACLGGVVAVWPLGALGQQSEHTRRIGLTMTLASDDPEAKARVTAFLQTLKDLGWTVGHNLQIDYRWGPAMSGSIAKILPNWSLFIRTSFWRLGARLWSHCCRRRGLCR